MHPSTVIAVVAQLARVRQFRPIIHPSIIQNAIMQRIPSIKSRRQRHSWHPRTSIPFPLSLPPPIPRHLLLSRVACFCHYPIYFLGRFTRKYFLFQKQPACVVALQVIVCFGLGRQVWFGFGFVLEVQLINYDPVHWLHWSWGGASWTIICSLEGVGRIDERLLGSFIYQLHISMQLPRPSQFLHRSPHLLLPLLFRLLFLPQPLNHQRRHILLDSDLIVLIRRQLELKKVIINHIFIYDDDHQYPPCASFRCL